MYLKNKEREKMKIIGFQSGHDVSYCILEDGVPILHEEMERFTREKEPSGCGLKWFFEKNPDMTDIDGFAWGNPPPSHLDWLDKESAEKARNMVGRENFKIFSHHDCHAANAFYTSTHKKSLVVSVDGGGNRIVEVNGRQQQFGETLAVYRGDGKNLQTVNIPYNVYCDGKVKFTGQNGLPLGNSLNLGKVWSNITSRVFGLSTGYPLGNQAGTVMAMATLGEPKYVHLFHDDMQYDPWADDAYLEVQEVKSHIMTSAFVKLKQYAEESEQEKFNVAASLQRYTENRFFNILSRFILEDDDTIGFSGGVSLNCVMIGKVKQHFPQIKHVYCDPVPYDGGLSLGAARLMWHTLGNERVYNNAQNRSPYLGKIYTEQEVRDACERESQVLVTNVTDQEVVDFLAQEKIIAVFGGGAESGRRALGNRSILADPRSKQMKDIINQKVKHRQWYRPFAPSILSEHVAEWFEDAYESPYMSMAPKFKEDKRKLVPAVVHYDGTGRLQSVEKELNPWYHSFISLWHQKSGVPIVLNTSFNDREPIVETPEHAINCFVRTNIDYLYFYDYGLLLTKK